MRFGTSEFRSALTILLFVLLLGGCAPTPWTTLIEDERRQSIEDAYRHFAHSQNQCMSGWDADIIVTWKSSLKEYSVSAYLQALPPSYFKLVIVNPLGQPLKLLSTDGSDYLYIDVVDRSSISGSIRSWAIRYDLPYALVRRSWPDWLQGRPGGDKQRLITEIRQDNDARGVWITIAESEDQVAEENLGSEPDPDISYPVYEYVLVDPETGVVKEQIVIDERQKPQATIVYNQWRQIRSCLYPIDMEFTGLPYSTDIHLQFSETQQTELTPNDFLITVPPGFSRTMMP